MLNLITQDLTESVVITDEPVMGLQIDGKLVVGFGVAICTACTAITRTHFGKTGVAKRLTVEVPPATECAWFDCSDRAVTAVFLA